MTRPLVLDFDQSVEAPADAQVLDLTQWQERIRFGCSNAALDALRRELSVRMPAEHSAVFLGSGDFHHVSALLIARHAHRGPLQVVICDNHPDNMRFPFGVHCGSWVHRVAQLPGVSHVHVLGISSSDVSTRQAWQNRLMNLRAGRLSYWCTGVDTRWSKHIGLDKAIHSFQSPDELLRAFAAALRRSTEPIYLSIDKDVLSARVARTNWDQGCFLELDLLLLVSLCAGRLMGSDVCGDISAYRYRTIWKRWLSYLDAQHTPSSALLAQARQAHTRINERLLEALQSAERSARVT